MVLDLFPVLFPYLIKKEICVLFNWGSIAAPYVEAEKLCYFKKETKNGFWQRFTQIGQANPLAQDLPGLRKTCPAGASLAPQRTAGSMYSVQT